MSTLWSAADAIRSGEWFILFKILRLHVAMLTMLLHLSDFGLGSEEDFLNTEARAPNLAEHAPYLIAWRAMWFGPMVHIYIYIYIIRYKYASVHVCKCNIFLSKYNIQLIQIKVDKNIYIYIYIYIYHILWKYLIIFYLISVCAPTNITTYIYARAHISANRTPTPILVYTHELMYIQQHIWRYPCRCYEQIHFKWLGNCFWLHIMISIFPSLNFTQFVTLWLLTISPCMKTWFKRQ